jgi:hypothetical protein
MPASPIRVGLLGCAMAFSPSSSHFVLEIHRPSAEPGLLAQELLKEWPSYIAYSVDLPRFFGPFLT